MNEEQWRKKLEELDEDQWRKLEELWERQRIFHEKRRKMTRIAVMILLLIADGMLVTACVRGGYGEYASRITSVALALTAFCMYFFYVWTPPPEDGD